MKLATSVPTPNATTGSSGRSWGLILAGGEGARLRTLTTMQGGVAVPKQFCSLLRGRTLLEDAIARARPVVAPADTCTIVSHPHRQWWSALLADQPAQNVIVQPRNRGTGIGIAFAALHIATRDPQARIVILPADHHVGDELVLRQGLRLALARLEQNAAAPILLGMAPTHVDEGLGYILPGARDATGTQTVARFIEKPDDELARSLIAEGGLWNTFIVVSAVSALLKMFESRYAELLLEMRAIVEHAATREPPGAGWTALVDMYERLPTVDFCSDLLQGHESALRVLQVAECGWSDLGTPRRLGEALRHLRLSQSSEAGAAAPYLCLAAQHARYLHDSGGHHAAPSV